MYKKAQCGRPDEAPPNSSVNGDVNVVAVSCSCTKAAHTPSTG